MEIFKSFTFDAAHHLAQNVAPGHKYAGLHGHSFEVELTFAGEPDPETGWIRDFGEIDAGLASVRDALDHKFLNEIAGLEKPTLENLARWIWRQLKSDFPQLARIKVTRGANREGCIYSGPL